MTHDAGWEEKMLPTRDRLVFLYLHLVGHVVQVQVKDGTVWEGMVHSTGKDDFSVVLQHARLKASKVHPNPQKQKTKPKEMLQIPTAEIHSLHAIEVNFGGERTFQEGGFFTDSDITNRKSMGGIERELQPCVLIDPNFTGNSLEFEVGNELLEKKTTAWDQFDVNRKLFGYKSTWDENLYTTKLDLSQCPEHVQKEAARLAREIERGDHGNNIHVLIERNKLPDIDMDEELLYSSVHRDPKQVSSTLASRCSALLSPPQPAMHTPSPNPAASLAVLTSSNNINKYVPPHKRKELAANPASPAPQPPKTDSTQPYSTNAAEFLQQVVEPTQPVPASAMSAADFEKQLLQTDPQEKVEAEPEPQEEPEPVQEKASPALEFLHLDSGISWADSVENDEQQEKEAAHASPPTTSTSSTPNSASTSSSTEPIATTTKKSRTERAPTLTTPPSQQQIPSLPKTRSSLHSQDPLVKNASTVADVAKNLAPVDLETSTSVNSPKLKYAKTEFMKYLKTENKVNREQEIKSFMAWSTTLEQRMRKVKRSTPTEPSTEGEQSSDVGKSSESSSVPSQHGAPNPDKIPNFDMTPQSSPSTPQSMTLSSSSVPPLSMSNDSEEAGGESSPSTPSSLASKGSSTLNPMAKEWKPSLGELVLPRTSSANTAAPQPKKAPPVAERASEWQRALKLSRDKPVAGVMAMALILRISSTDGFASKIGGDQLYSHEWTKPPSDPSELVYYIDLESVQDETEADDPNHRPPTDYSTISSQPYQQNQYATSYPSYSTPQQMAPPYNPMLNQPIPQQRLMTAPGQGYPGMDMSGAMQHQRGAAMYSQYTPSQAQPMGPVPGNPNQAWQAPQPQANPQMYYRDQHQGPMPPAPHPPHHGALHQMQHPMPHMPAPSINQIPPHMPQAGPPNTMPSKILLQNKNKPDPVSTQNPVPQPEDPVKGRSGSTSGPSDPNRSLNRSTPQYKPLRPGESPTSNPPAAQPMSKTVLARRGDDMMNKPGYYQGEPEPPMGMANNRQVPSGHPPPHQPPVQNSPHQPPNSRIPLMPPAVPTQPANQMPPPLQSVPAPGTPTTPGSTSLSSPSGKSAAKFKARKSNNTAPPPANNNVSTSNAGQTRPRKK